MRITIYEDTEDEVAMADLLREIARQLDEGMTRGFHPGWETVDAGDSVTVWAEAEKQDDDPHGYCDACGTDGPLWIVTVGVPAAPAVLLCDDCRPTD